MDELKTRIVNINNFLIKRLSEVFINDSYHYIQEKAIFIDINKKLEDINNYLINPNKNQEIINKYEEFLTSLEIQYGITNRQVLEEQATNISEGSSLENNMDELVDVQAFQQLFGETPIIQSK